MLTLIVFAVVILVPDTSLYYVLIDFENMIIESIGGEDVSDYSGNNNIDYSFATMEDRSPPSSSLLTENRADRLEYNVRYFCGTITGQDGPLRPGRYNSDINIFNRQSYSISFFWKAVPSSNLRTTDFSVNSDTNLRLQTLDPGDSISISCIDLVPSVPLYSNDTNGTSKFFEGVSTITVDLDPTLQAAISSSSRGTLVSPPVDDVAAEPTTNILSVDAVYTVNALEVPSREIVLQLIEYSIDSQDSSRKLPSEIISKPLSITVPIKTNETVNPDSRVRDVLANEFSLNSTERQNLDISIRNLSLGVGALDDNHAISLQRINAYQPLPAPPSAPISP